MYQVWRFIEPGLYRQERSFGLWFIFSGSFLFLTGTSFVYFIVYPSAFHFLLNFGDGKEQALITISSYLSFFTTTTLVFGLVFELPLILSLLGISGVIDHHFLANKRRYAIVLLAVLSAMITPPDVISMAFMMGPMILLYEVSIWLVYFLGNRAKARENST